MRVHVGDVGPLPAVQAFECGSTRTLERKGEYDSDDAILTANPAEYQGILEVLDCERTDIYQGLMGKSENQLVDVAIDNCGNAPIMLNVWSKSKKFFRKSFLVINPTWGQMPFATTLEGVTTLRYEYQATRAVKFPAHACGFLVYAAGGTGPYNFGSKTPVALSRRFGGQYVACVVNKVADPTSPNDFDYNYMCVASSTSSSFTLLDTPVADSTVIAYYAYVSTAEAGGYICSTV